MYLITLNSLKYNTKNSIIFTVITYYTVYEDKLQYVIFKVQSDSKFSRSKLDRSKFIQCIEFSSHLGGQQNLSFEF
jgi:hypothetical protein